MSVTAPYRIGKDIKRIIATYPGKVDPAEVREKVMELTEAGRITERDENLLEHLRELNVLSLNQIHRLLWPEATERVAYNRLYFLTKSHLLGGARAPATEMTKWQLPIRKVYTMGAGGWLWLMGQVNTPSINHLKRDQVMHDLLVAEIYVRLVEAVRQRGEEWMISWAGERAARFCPDNNNTPLLAPDGLAIVQQQRGDRVAILPFFIEFDKSREAHGRPSSDWGRKVGGYNRFYGSKWQMHPQLSNCPAFPWVVVITHGAQRLLNLAGAITKHRQEPVVYFLGLWADLVECEDIITAPIWLVITADGAMMGKNREDRQPLLPAPGANGAGPDQAASAQALELNEEATAA
jgi:hypothetical protein